MDTKQQNRWSDEELQLIKSVFKDKLFVYAVRDVMMGFTDTFEHQATDAVLGILRKNLLPEFSPDVPIQRQQDLCHSSLDFISGFNAEQGILRIEAYDIGKDYLERRFGVLQGQKDEGESLEDLKDKTKAKDREDRFIRMLTYLQLGGYIEKSLNELVTVADHLALSPQEIKERQEIDSSK